MPRTKAPAVAAVQPAVRRARRRREAAEAAPPTGTPPPPAATPSPVPSGKLGLLVGLLRRPEGASLAEMMQATGWQVHSVRGALSGALKKKLGLVITSTKTDAGRVYRIVDEVAR